MFYKKSVLVASIALLLSSISILPAQASTNCSGLKTSSGVSWQTSSGGEVHVTYYGTSKADTIVINLSKIHQDADFVRVLSGSSNDTICVFGDFSYDKDRFVTLNGEKGNDTIMTYLVDAQVKPSLIGESGDDTLRGNGMLNGGDGNDKLYGDNNYPNTLVSGNGNDTVYGGNYGDMVNNAGGNDKIYANAGNDFVLNISTGASLINGGDGNDRIESTYGSNSIYGNAGKDKVTLNKTSNFLDFNAAEDTRIVV